MKYFNDLLNKTPMYQLVMMVLWVYVLFSFPLAYFGKIAFTPISLLLSLIILFVTCVGLNYICCKIFKLPFQFEYSVITALTLYLILLPAESNSAIVSLLVAGSLATLSKYFLVWRNTHIFNPAAIGIFATSVLGMGTAFWWVGNPYLLPLTLLGGLVILQKTRRYALIISGVLAAILGVILSSYFNQIDIFTVFLGVFISGPVIYFLSPMLQEPHTIAKNKFQQIFYGFAIVILPTIFAIMNWRLGWISMDFTLALLIGNIFSFILSHRQRLVLKLKEIKKLNESVSEFIFESGGLKNFKFKAGEYMEWCLPTAAGDSRSIRRYFTISSSPNQAKNNNKIAFATKFPGLTPALSGGEGVVPQMSSFKKALKDMKVGDTMYATQLGGDFLLPKNKNINLCLIAGGIGITPFISQIRHLNDIKENRNITLFYSVRSVADIAYEDLFKDIISKCTLNLRVVLVIADGVSGLTLQESKNLFTESGYLNDKILNKYLQDFKNTEFYLSGPNVMVDALCATLGECKIHNSKIHTDYFPGF